MLDHYYVSTGAQTKMYTLRQQFEEKVWFKLDCGKAESTIVVRDWYVQNLSTDKKQAVERAAELGYEVCEPKFTLQEIEKRDRELCQEARIAKEEQELITQAMKLNREFDLVKNGMFPYGRNEGRTFSWMMDEFGGQSWFDYYYAQGKLEGAGATEQLMSAVLAAKYPDCTKIANLSDKGNGKFYEPMKSGRQKDVKVTCVATFGFEGYYGWQSIVKFITATGELLMYMGSGDVSCRKGEECLIDFGVKDTEVYKNTHQTKIQRVKVKHT